MPEISIVVLGSGAVGKSTLCIHFVQGHFCSHYDSTIEDVYRRSYLTDGDNATLTLVDTAGQDAFSSMREPYLRSGNCFILQFSITDSESLQKLKVIYAQLVRVRGEGQYVPCVVVGNKTDLAAQRAVPSEQGKEFARHVGCHYFEITCRDKGQVDEIFTHIVRLYRRGSAAPAPGVNNTAAADPVQQSKAAATAGSADNGGKAAAASNNNATVTPTLKKKSFFDKCSIG